MVKNTENGVKLHCTGLTHHFWWYIFHITALHKLSTLLEGDPKNFDWKKISVKNIEAEDNERLCDSETLF